MEVCLRVDCQTIFSEPVGVGDDEDDDDDVRWVDSTRSGMRELGG